MTTSGRANWVTDVEICRSIFLDLNVIRMWKADMKIRVVDVDI